MSFELYSLPNRSDSGISDAALGGIVVAVIAVAVIISCLIVILCIRQRRRQKRRPVILAMGPGSVSEPLVPPLGPSYVTSFPNPSSNTVPPASTQAGDTVSENDMLTARTYEIPASSSTSDVSGAGATSAGIASTLNSKQRMMRAAQRYGDGGSGGSYGNHNTGDDLSSHTGPISSTSSLAGRSRPHAGRNANGVSAWAQPMESLYPHGVPVPMAAPAIPDYATETGYLPSETESSGNNNTSPNPPARTETSIYSNRPPSAPPPYPRSPPPIGDKNAPPVPNLPTVHEYSGPKH